MIRIYADTEKEKEKMIETLATSYKCPFLDEMTACDSQKDCRDCIRENIEIKVISQIEKER